MMMATGVDNDDSGATSAPVDISMATLLASFPCRYADDDDVFTGKISGRKKSWWKWNCCCF